MEKKGRSYAGPAMLTSSEPPGHAHKAKPLPSPAERSEAEIEARNLTNLPSRRWRSVCVTVKQEGEPSRFHLRQTSSLSDGLRHHGVWPRL